MKNLPWILAILGASTAMAGETRIYQTDVLGRTQYNKQSYVVQQNGRIIPTDVLGRKQYNKQQYQIVGDGIKAVDVLGRVQHGKPTLKIR